MDVKIKLTGNLEIDKVLKGLPLHVNHKVLQAAHTSAAKALVTAEKLTAPEGPTGKLIDSIGVIKTPIKRANSVGEIHVGPRRGRYKGHAAHLVEYGTKPRMNKKGANRGQVSPKPFARPAWERTKTKVVSAINDELGRSLHRFMRRTIKRYG